MSEFWLNTPTSHHNLKLVYLKSWTESKMSSGGVILENLSGKKLFVLVLVLFICQIGCFLLGGLIGTFVVCRFFILRYRNMLTLICSANTVQYRHGISFQVHLQPKQFVVVHQRCGSMCYTRIGHLHVWIWFSRQRHSFHIPGTYLRMQFDLSWDLLNKYIPYFFTRVQQKTQLCDMLYLVLQYYIYYLHRYLLHEMARH